jgi:hypothetical protein
MKEADWDIIYKVHLYGAYSVTKAAWNIMREQVLFLYLSS